MKVRNLIFHTALLFTLFFTACTENGKTTLQSIAKNADKVEVKLMAVTNMNSEGGEADLVGSTIDATKINALAEGMNGTEAPEYKCGYDGKITFFEGDKVLLEVDYNLDPECQHVSYFIGDAHYAKHFTPEGVELVEEILVNGA